MKENLLKRIFLISAVLFFIGVLLCFALFTVVNVVGAKRLLDNVIEENESGFAAIESQEELVKRVDEVDAALIRISVLSADGILIADNVLEQGSEAGLDAEDAADVLERGVRYKLQRLYGEGETLYVAYTAVQNAALGDIIVVYGIDIDFNDLNFWLLAGACAAGWIVITLATYFITRNYITSATESLDKLRTMLENVNKGNYSEISYKSRFKDVQEIVSNINVAARNIDDTIKNLKNEQVKNTFILSNVDQGIVAVNSKRRIIISNGAFSDIFGSNPGLVGVDLSTVLGEGTEQDKIYSALEEGRSGTIVDITRDGRTYRVENVAEPEHWPEGWGETGSMLLFTDVTYEANMSKMRSEFFDNASHELKSPLTAITGYAELLAEPSLSPVKRAKCIEEIRANAGDMLELINNMLRLSKLDSSDRPRDIRRLKVEEVCGEVVKRLAVQAEEMGVSVTIDGSAECSADENDMFTMLSNVVSNAIKYNKRGGSVKIALTPEGSGVRIEVSDTGIGIAPEHIGRIFERFFKVDTARTRSKALSTGLGLSIVKQLADHYGAKIDVKSEVDKGTCVTLIFGR